VSSWTVRLEREHAEVLEEYAPSTSSRPGRKRLLLVRESGQFRFADGLR